MTGTLLFPEMGEPQGSFDYPQPLTEKYRPAHIQDFAGLSETKKTLSGFVRRPADCGFLFVGPAGTGKTSMAWATANELRAFVHHVPAQECTVQTVRDIAFSCHYYPPCGYARHAVIVDEADMMSAAAQNAILSYLDGTETIPNTVWIFTANGTDRLADRFLSRNRVLNFSTYGIQADAARLLETVWITETGAPKPNFARIIKEENGNVRAALMTLETKLLAL